MSCFRDLESEGNFFSVTLDPNTVYWCNPPFCLMREVIDVIALSEALVYLLVPDRKNKSWWSIATGLSSDAWILPLKEMLPFEPGVERECLTHPSFRVRVVVIDRRRHV